MASSSFAAGEAIGDGRSPAVQVWGLRVALPVLPPSDHGEAARGATIRRFRLRLSGPALQRLLAPTGLQIRLAPGGAALEATVGGFRVRADVAGSLTTAGRLRVEATSLRLGGWLPAPPQLVALALARMEGKPGLRVVGPQALELDLGAALEHLLRQWEVRVDAPIRRLTIVPEFLEVECSSDEDEPTRPA
jgi:hypothetical protein